jgi:arsenite methyltransferase
MLSGREHSHVIAGLGDDDLGGAAPDAEDRAQQVFGDALYADTDTAGATDAALAASLGCGVPIAVADLHEGETVLDLGSGAGAGADVLISARRVAPTGSGSACHCRMARVARGATRRAILR